METPYYFKVFLFKKMIYHNAKKVINGTYYVKLFQESDISKKFEGFHNCYFFIEKEYLVKENIKNKNIDEFIISLFNKKYNPENYMKDAINIVYLSSESKDDKIFIDSLIKDFNLKNMPSLINIKKY